MRRLLSLIGLTVVLGASQAAAGTPPIVMEAKGSPSRVVYILHEGAWIQVRTLPFPDQITPAPLPDPTPGPTPNPEPPPAPTPPVVVTTPLTAIYVAAADPTPEQAAMTRNSVIDAAMPLLDTEWRWYEADEPGIQVKGTAMVNGKAMSILDYANTVGLPAVVIQKRGGQVLELLQRDLVTSPGGLGSCFSFRFGRCFGFRLGDRGVVLRLGLCSSQFGLGSSVVLDIDEVLVEGRRFLVDFLLLGGRFFTRGRRCFHRGGLGRGRHSQGRPGRGSGQNGQDGPDLRIGILGVEFKCKFHKGLHVSVVSESVWVALPL